MRSLCEFILASHEAKSNAFDEALLNDMDGNVAEGPGANVFFEKDGKLITPAPGNILPGITRATVMDICNELNIPVEEKLFTFEDMKNADAAFFCGTAAEVIGWESLMEVPFKKPWSETLGKRYRKRIKIKLLNRIKVHQRNTTRDIRFNYAWLPNSEHELTEEVRRRDMIEAHELTSEVYRFESKRRKI